MMTIQQFFFWFDDILKPTEPMFRLVPGDKLDFKLTGTSFSVGQLLGHIPSALMFNAKIMAGDDWPVKSMREVLVINRRQSSIGTDEAILQLRQGIELFKNAVQSRGEEFFQEAMIKTPQWGEVKCWRFAMSVGEHHIRHLMELHLNLKVLGIPVDTRTLYRG